MLTTATTDEEGKGNSEQLTIYSFNRIKTNAINKVDLLYFIYLLFISLGEACAMWGKWYKKIAQQDGPSPQAASVNVRKVLRYEEG